MSGGIAEQRVHVELVSFEDENADGKKIQPENLKLVKAGDFFFDLNDAQIDRKIRHKWHSYITDPAKVVVLISRPFLKA